MISFPAQSVLPHLRSIQDELSLECAIDTSLYGLDLSLTPPHRQVEGSYFPPGSTNSTQNVVEVRCLTTQVMEALWVMATLGLCNLYRQTWKFVPRDNIQHVGLLEAQRDDLLILIEAWVQVSCKINKGWKLARLGCALLLPLSIALLQLDAIFGDVYGRTAAIAAFLLSGGGLAMTGVFMSILPQFHGRKGRQQWVEASRGQKLDDLEAVRFWSLLALPVSLMACSILFSVSTMLILAWNWENASVTSGGKAGNILTSIFLTVLTVLIVVPVYYAIRLAKKIC